MNIRLFTPALSALALCACTAAQPPAAAQQDGIPYPAPETQAQLDAMGIQITKLEQQLSSLQNRVRQLERRYGAARSNRPGNTAASAPPPADTSAETPDGTYAQAQKHFQNNRYAAAISLLKHADSGGDGSENARRRMYLLLQSHQRLGNCESVINIGSRYANRFRSSLQASEALFAVGQCQYRMQQQDIARDTWQKLIQTYPDSPAAKRAYQQLKKR